MDSRYQLPRALRVPEIRDYTLSFLTDENRSLKSCSLVCHSLSWSASHQLFRTIRLNPSFFMPVMNEDGTHEVSRQERLKSLTPRLTDNVRELVLDHHQGRPFDLPTLPRLPMQLIADILVSFPRLRRMSLVSSHEFVTDLTLLSLPSSYPFRVPSNPPLLDSLHISMYKLSFQTMQLEKFLALFQEVKSLTLEAIDVIPMFAPPPPSTALESEASRPKVCSLIVSSFHYDIALSLPHILAMVANSVNTTSLSSVCLGNYQLHDSVAATNNFLRHHVHKLTEFASSIHKSAMWTVARPIFDSGTCR